MRGPDVPQAPGRRCRPRNGALPAAPAPVPPGAASEGATSSLSRVTHWGRARAWVLGARGRPYGVGEEGSGRAPPSEPRGGAQLLQVCARPRPCPSSGFPRRSHRPSLVPLAGLASALGSPQVGPFLTTRQSSPVGPSPPPHGPACPPRGPPRHGPPARCSLTHGGPERPAEPWPGPGLQIPATSFLCPQLAGASGEG